MELITNKMTYLKLHVGRLPQSILRTLYLMERTRDRGEGDTMNHNVNHLGPAVTGSQVESDRGGSRW